MYFTRLLLLRATLLSKLDAFKKRPLGINEYDATLTRFKTSYENVTTIKVEFALILTPKRHLPVGEL